MNLLVKLVEWTAVVGLIWFALFAEVLSENVHRQRAGQREAQVRDAQQVLARDKAQSALDAAYAKAEEQAHAAAETGQGWQMPSREQCAAAAAYGGTHERLLMCDADRALEVALLESHLNARSRPPITADTDPDGTTAW